jgi:hypothetical protein
MSSDGPWTALGAISYLSTTYWEARTETDLMKTCKPVLNGNIVQLDEIIYTEGNFV